MDLRNQPRGVAFLLAVSLLLTLGCATRRYDAYGTPYYEPYDHQHATEGAIVGGLAGAGLGSAVAGPHDAAAGFFLGGALGAITGAVIGDSLDREHQRVGYPPAPPWPDGPPPPPQRRRDDRGRDDRGWDDHDYDRDHDRGWDDHDYDRGSDDDGYDRDHDRGRDDDPQAYEPPPPAPLLLSLPGEVLFAPGSDRLEPGAERRLRSVAKAMRDHPATEAVIRGHASAAESREGPLSEARSRVVRDYLLRQGVAPSRVVAVGMGSRFPVASERTPEGRQRNRRVEIEIRSDRGHDLARLW